ncbi:hypothetical protein, partial [Staphylococcus aureus]
MSRGLGDVYKRQLLQGGRLPFFALQDSINDCLLYTSDAADDTPCVDLGGRRIIKKFYFYFHH